MAPSVPVLRMLFYGTVIATQAAREKSATQETDFHRTRML